MKLEYKTHCTLPTDNGDFDFHLFTEKTPEKIHEHFALIMGDIKNQTDVLLRIHSECCTGDVFGCQRCDCQDQLYAAIDMIKLKTPHCLAITKSGSPKHPLYINRNMTPFRWRKANKVYKVHSLHFALPDLSEY